MSKYIGHVKVIGGVDTPSVRGHATVGGEETTGHLYCYSEVIDLLTETRLYMLYMFMIRA